MAPTPENKEQPQFHDGPRTTGLMSLNDFLKVLAASGLVPVSEVEAARTALGPDDRAAPDAAVHLAKLLIERGHLTRYQARKLLAGVTRGFFLGRYRILRRLGAGGMGKVYLAVHEDEGHKVAIKVLPPKRAAESEQYLRRFEREQLLSQRIQHPNIARTLEVGRQGNVHFMVMEYIPGDSLYHLVREGGGPLRVPDAARVFLKLLDGLAAAHAGGLVHRDIKPSNVMITPDGDAKLLDLGLAKTVGDAAPLTRPNTVLGTLDYASPEQLSDAARADARSDLYSLGCTLYFTLSGRAPFEGGDVVNKIYKQRMEDPEPLEQVARGVPAAFAAVVRKLMAKDPNDRYQSCAELRGDLARWTDPNRVRAILGSEAEAARAFKPPPPELDDDDLRLLPDPDPSLPQTALASLRDLGDAEPGLPPMYRPPPPPRPAVLIPESDVDPLPPRPPGGSDDLGWLYRFALVCLLLGLLAIVVFSLLH